MLVVTLLMSLTTFSQTDTNNKLQVCLPIDKARLIVQDLVRFDLLTQEHAKTVFVLDQTQNKLIFKDSIINNLQEKVTIQTQETKTQELKYTAAADRIIQLEKEVGTLQRKNKRLQGWVKGFGGGLLATMATVVSLVLIK